MRRQAFDEETPLPPHGSPPRPQWACNHCRGPATGAMLSALGGRCSECFARYCREPIASRVPVLPAGLVLAKDDPMNAIKRLVARRDAGEQLGPIQRQAVASWDRRRGRIASDVTVIDDVAERQRRAQELTERYQRAHPEELQP